MVILTSVKVSWERTGYCFWLALCTRPVLLLAGRPYRGLTALTFRLPGVRRAAWRAGVDGTGGVGYVPMLAVSIKSKHLLTACIVSHELLARGPVSVTVLGRPLSFLQSV